MPLETPKPASPTVWWLMTVMVATSIPVFIILAKREQFTDSPSSVDNDMVTRALSALLSVTPRDDVIAKIQSAQSAIEAAYTRESYLKVASAAALLTALWYRT